MSLLGPVLIRLQRAWPVTVGVHVIQCVFAATFALPFVRSVSVPPVLVSPRVAEWVGALRLGDSLSEGTGVRALLPLGLAALNYPWLSVAWLRALSEEAPFTEHAQFAMGRYRAAIGIAVFTLVAIGAFVALSGLAALGVRVTLDGVLDERALDLSQLACFVPAVVGALWLVTVQDAAYAAVSGGCRGGRQIERAAIGAITPQLMLQRAVLVIGQAVLAIAAWAVPRLALGPGTAADFVVLVTTQSAAFVIVCLRAGWLASVLEVMSARYAGLR